MRTVLRQDTGLGWAIALTGEPRHWPKNMYWPHSPPFEAGEPAQHGQFRTVLRQAIAELADRPLLLDNKGHRKQTMTIDADSLPVEVHGQQFGSEWNGHYHRRMYHPLVASCAETRIWTAVASGEGAYGRGRLGTFMRIGGSCKATLCRSAIPYRCALTTMRLSGLESRKVPYVARIRNNQVLGRLAEPYLKRPPGRPPQTPRGWCYEESYQAGTWVKATPGGAGCCRKYLAICSSTTSG